MIIFACLLLGLTLSGGTLAQTQSSNPSNTTTMEKKLIGNTLALYPMPLTVVGAEVEGRVNWLVVAHVGIIGHDRILVSMSQSHYTNRGIRATPPSSNWPAPAAFRWSSTPATPPAAGESSSTLIR